MSRLYFKFGWQIPGQIATLRSFLTMCHDKEDSLLPRRTRDSGSIFGGGGNRGGERHHRAPLLSSASVSKKQDGTPRRRWRTGGEMSSWHTLACVRKIAHHVRAWQRSFCRRGFDLTGWQRCKWSFPAPFFFFFPTLFLHESQRLAGKSCLSIHGCETRMPGPVFGRVDGLVIDTFLWLNWQRTCKQIDEVKVNTSEIWGSLTKTGIPPLDAITSTVEWQLLIVLKPAEFTPDLLIIDEFNKCANRLILRFVDLFFFYWDGFV